MNVGRALDDAREFGWEFSGEGQWAASSNAIACHMSVVLPFFTIYNKLLQFQDICSKVTKYQSLKRFLVLKF